ncbi:peptide/nickel transport system ATP-binding protein [Nakamurella panacisegetis]|uniref:Peptide/nickel transport system ATP-binding protein n=1 Tax=Nakamurella panacisegetis TaxID=1090615 RepID=A0A1H0IA17_9ACTN|nr:ABC transporter ATP-binding protein [Nakamurella panacisegetis]SDO28304.1 peptide/nickel transport system ATP-binding protein [Nakamurella panacisegetis]
MTTPTGAPNLNKTNAPVLTVRDLDIDFWVDGTWYPAVTRNEFTLMPGEVLSIVGESGSGKSTTAMAILGLLPKNSHVEGSIKLGERELVGASERAMRAIRGKEIAMIFQEPMTALNPVYTIGFQIAEMLRAHKAMAPKAARARAIELLTLVEIPDPERRVDSYPHQLSGGQRQRAMIAQALALDPMLLVADEPTTALDVTVQAEILKLMRDLKHRVDAAIILITHDMGVVADMADRIIVMKDGKIVETGDAEKIFKHPEQAYTIQLLNAVPHLGSIVADEGVPMAEDLAEGIEGGATTTHRPEEVAEDPTKRADLAPGVPPVVELHDVAVEYPKRGRTPAFRAVDKFTLSIGQGEVVGLVGESGSGKTTIGRALVGLLPFVQGTANVIGTNIVGASKKDLLQVRKDVSFVFQDPGSSLNPRLPVGESIGEPLLLQKMAKGKDLSNRVEKLLDQVQLPRAMRNRYPHELSGGQRQRVGIARALALNPKLLIADEPTSALDVSVQARVLDLFQELQAQQGFACLFISHDLAVVEILSRRIAVLHHGRLVEMGTREQILSNPIDDYTKRLLAAVPVPDPAEQAIRREQRDKLLAAGVGVEPDEFEVFA